MEPRDIDWSRLDRFVAGEGTAEELEELRRWVEADAELQVLAETMRTAQRLPEGRAVTWDAPGSWSAVTQRLGLPVERGAGGRGRPARPLLQLNSVGAGRRWRVWRVAGIAAAIVGAVLVAERWVDRELAGRGVSEHTEPAREYATLRGQRLVVHLPDRTQITLAPESRLRLRPGYGQDSRDVDLVGQAYFVVTHDSTSPFAVHTDKLIARDLGTRFVVDAYPADSSPGVVVAEGLVALGRAGGDAGMVAPDVALADSLLLQPGDLGRVSAAGDLIHRRGVPVDQYLAWTAGELVFRGTPLRDAIVELGRWYDIDIHLADVELGNEQITASFKDQSALAVINLVAAAAGLTVEQRGAQFVLDRR